MAGVLCGLRLTAPIRLIHQFLYASPLLFIGYPIVDQLQRVSNLKPIHKKVSIGRVLLEVFFFANDTLEGAPLVDGNVFDADFSPFELEVGLVVRGSR